ncbi:hypothetical protein H0H92_000757, partial [Tricholoma furcatifolium]
RAIPPGLSARDAKILKSVQRRAHYLDKGFSLCGLRFGWGFLIGLIPVVGDAADVLLNYYLVIRKARQADLPPWLLQRMLFHNLVSAGVGFVPLVGDLLIAVYKPNSRNAALLEEMLRLRGEEALRLQASGVVASTSNQVDKDGKTMVKDNVEAGLAPAEGELAILRTAQLPAKKKSFGFLGLSTKVAESSESLAVTT